MEINPVKGTHDILEDESRKYYEVESLFRSLAFLYGYKEIRTPIIEHTPLFLRSVGEGSDIVNKEMYTFDDKGGRSITLRPEMTAGVLRSITSNKAYVNKELPLRYFYNGPCFRYERPQAGRYRQFHQLGVELLGSTSYLADVEVITLGYKLLSNIGLKNVKIKINSLGDDESRANYKVALKEYFTKHIDSMCEDCHHRLEVNPLRILDCKVPSDIEIVKDAPRMSDYLSEASKDRLNKVIDALTSLGIEVERDENLVRGLDYYTGVVFEYHITPKEGENDVGAIGGGGHYAKLLKELGGPDLEGVGLSFGEERLIYVSKEAMGESYNYEGPDFYFASLCEEALSKNLSYSEYLRNAGLHIETNYEVKSVKSALKSALKLNAKFIAFVGEDEIKNKVITIKNLKSQVQQTIKVENLYRNALELIDNYYKDLNN